MTKPGIVHDILSERFANIRSRIRSAAHRAHRSADEIKLIAISKTHPANAIREALSAGATDFGENRVQEAEPKIVDVGRTAARWHLVGHLQSNKARRAVKLFDVIHSVDSIELAQRLDRLCLEEHVTRLNVLAQVDLGHEETKTGISEQELPNLVEVLVNCPRLEFVGLMTLPPFFDDAEMARPFFSRLRELRNELAHQKAFGENGGELSMGMTNDFEVAIDEGATMVRIGTALFGERETH